MDQIMAMKFRDLPLSRVVFMAIGLVVALCANGTAYAQVKSYSDGVFRAVCYKEITDRVSVRVALYDDADLDLLIHSQIVDALRRANHTIDGSGLPRPKPAWCQSRSKANAETAQETGLRTKQDRDGQASVLSVSLPCHRPCG